MAAAAAATAADGRDDGDSKRPTTGAVTLAAVAVLLSPIVERLLGSICTVPDGHGSILRHFRRHRHVINVNTTIARMTCAVEDATTRDYGINNNNGTMTRIRFALTTRTATADDCDGRPSSIVLAKSTKRNDGHDVARDSVANYTRIPNVRRRERARVAKTTHRQRTRAKKTRKNVDARTV